MGNGIKHKCSRQNTYTKEKSISKVVSIGEVAKNLKNNFNIKGAKVMREVKINIYNFNELEKKIQEKVINNYIDELISITNFEKLSKNSNMYKAYKKANELQTPWFLGQYIWQFCKKQILKDLSNLEFRDCGDVYCDLIYEK